MILGGYTLKVNEKIFREIYKKICLLTDEKIVEKINLTDIFDYPPEEKLSGFVSYTCINLNGELIFEILAGAKVSDERIKIFPASYKKNISFKRHEVEDVKIKILPQNYFNAFQDKIQVLEDFYKVDAIKEKIRMSESLDELRHPNFPDDVAVLFFRENFRPEYAWVRCETAEKKNIVGTLLNKTQQNFGYKVGDKITFGVTDFEGENICVLF